ncbi:CapA family protein [Staphylococcus pseudoxylosus]|uniref:CapA family protein n=1 Tax=Staphylococcus pseudoxylosus TaxID=2282419 RepID=A0AAQ0MIN6_9STAP|nr:CapA family protein [Staphylococcus pseudoxylosus]MCE5000868.1 CapA family protein [Staphylococcus pseudoxylosus]MEB6170259.1 CapA family protein [Staphylococcus pseudoxylosus]MEB6331588.1 CapA family protein [Staphylococcus pseudoxylosus]RMI86119.1 CapA family protein [Staphylococcus pseudoxylosus]
MRYRILLTFLFSLFLTLCIFCLSDQKNLTHEASFYAVGDNLIHPVVYRDALQSNGSFNFEPMYESLKKEIQAADIAYINQESPIGGDEKGLSGFKQFNTPNDIAKDVVNTGFNVVNGANNHALDQGTDGLLNEINVWEHFKNVFYTGTFKSQRDRDTIPTFNKKGIKIAMLSYTYGTNDIKPENKYQINYFNEEQIKKDVAKAKEQSDMVMVSAHWGNEGKHEPNAKQKKYAKVFADAGVDVVIGTHPHVIQPIQWVKGDNNHQTLVAYSLGNFLNGQSTGNESNALGGNLQFNIEKQPKGITIKDVKWKSLVTHYDIANPLDSNTRQNFKMYPLTDYSNNKAKQHALNATAENEMTKDKLESITKKVIDNQYLDDSSY